VCTHGSATVLCTRASLELGDVGKHLSGTAITDIGFVLTVWLNYGLLQTIGAGALVLAVAAAQVGLDCPTTKI
jgi:hypothetical protein